MRSATHSLALRAGRAARLLSARPGQANLRKDRQGAFAPGEVPLRVIVVTHSPPKCPCSNNLGGYLGGDDPPLGVGSTPVRRGI